MDQNKSKKNQKKTENLLNAPNKLRNIIRWEHYEYLEDDEYVFDEDALNNNSNDSEFVFDSPQLYIPTQMGLVPTKFYQMDFDHISLWNAYTNFTITKSIAKIIESVEGVESLEIKGRYRFRVGVAPLFNDQDTLKAIQDILQCNPPTNYYNELPEEIKPKINKLTKILWTKYMFWFIRIDATNKINNYGSNNKLDFLEKLNVEKNKIGKIIMFDGTTFEKLKV